VVNIFLQVFGEGQLTDGQARTVDASNALFIMTSNLGYEPQSQLHEEDTKFPINTVMHASDDDLIRAARGHFRPEFLNRIDEIVVFQPLQETHMVAIAKIQLERLRKLLYNQQIQLNWSSDVVLWLARKGFDPQFGARPLKRLIDNEIKNRISGLIIDGTLKPTHIAEITLLDDKVQIGFASPDTI
jgi:ATP-dependent Clp protease ATP-binding subunit ClpB